MAQLERRIITGLVVSSEYLRRVAPFWDDGLLESPEFSRIARWCLSHWEKYQRAPDRDIEDIFYRGIKSDGIPKAEAELIERVLSKVSLEYERGDQFNAAYLYDLTVEYFRERELAQHAEQVQDLTERGQLAEAEALAAAFQPRSWATSRGLELGTEQGYAAVQAAFDRAAVPILRYPGAIGDLLNRHLIRDGFVAFMGPEKRGKTYWLTDVAFRGLRQKCNVAFFQAGDMTESQYLRRLAVHLARRSDDPEYCGPHWRPVGDCVDNQFDRCRRSDRNCDYGVFSDYVGFEQDPTMFQRLSKLSEVAEANPDYTPCDSATCQRRRACVWLAMVPEKAPLTGDEARKIVRKFFERYRRRFRLATYPSGTLTVGEIQSCLAEWERQDDFVPDVIAVDYSDIMAAQEREYRHRQDEIWKGLRSISQRYHALVMTATQADADSYRSSLLKLSNFTEDKRKYAHVTAMFGLNQDPQGREKELGIMRLNTIVAREGAFSSNDEVYVLQDLAAGRPFTESFRAKSRPSAAPVPEH